MILEQHVHLHISVLTHGRGVVITFEPITCRLCSPVCNDVQVHGLNAWVAFMCCASTWPVCVRVLLNSLVYAMIRPACLQTQVLEAARQALGSTDTTTVGATGAAPHATTQQQQLGGANPSSRPQVPNPPAAAGTSTSYKDQGPSSAGSVTSSNGIGSPTSSSSGSRDDEPLTRRWSPLAEEQDLTRHVLQQALDQMQRSGAPIESPPDMTTREREEKQWREQDEKRQSTRQPPGGWPSSSSGRDGGGGGGGAGSAGAAGGGTATGKGGRSSPPPVWAQSLLGEC